jgi:hypothetical protein
MVSHHWRTPLANPGDPDLFRKGTWLPTLIEECCK